MKLFSTCFLLSTILLTPIFAEETTMKHTLKDEVKLTADTKTVKVLASHNFKFIGLGFKKDQILDKHQTPTPAMLVVQFGSVVFSMSGKDYTLSAGDYFEIPAKVEHEIKGLEDSYLYLVK